MTVVKEARNGSSSSELFVNKIILAPMVRENSLPFRLLCLEYGADLVYTEELVDYRLSACKRLENKHLKTIDFVDKRGEVVLRTCQKERQQLILQLGSNDPERALKAARLVSNDVCGIDFNFGCPKSFSLSGGMGAALLEKPEQIKALLTTCVQNLDIPVTCKMRILPQLSSTLHIARLAEQCGVSAIAVHGRTKEQRPHHENNQDFIRAIVDTVRIPIIANGGSNVIRSHSDIIRYRDSTRASSIMVARAAMKNPSIFMRNGVLEPVQEVIERFVKLAVLYNNYIALTKYTIQALMASGNFGGEFVSKFHAAHDFETICNLFDLGDWYAQNRILGHDNENPYDEVSDSEELKQMISQKRIDLATEGFDLVCDSIQFAPKIYGSTLPKSQLMSHVDRHRTTRPSFELFRLGQHCYYCFVTYENKCYLNKTYSNSKKGAEHASSMLVCERLGLVDIAHYRSRASASNRNIN